MKNKMAFRLSAYFAVALLVLAVTIGLLFAALFKEHTLGIYKQDMEKRANVIAEKISFYMSEQNADVQESEKKGSEHGSGYGAFIKNLNAVAMTDVWVVDQNLNMIITGEEENKNYTYADLPLNAEVVVSEVFEGKTTFSEDFSNLMETPTLTVGTPILDSLGKVAGVVLLHTSVDGIKAATDQGITILVTCILIALIASVILSTIFSLQYTKPLMKLKNTTLQLAEGDYSAKTDIDRKDEIGVLAKSVDTLSQRLSDAEKQSERFEKMRNDFVANVSHELRTPITVIRGSLEALLDGVVTDIRQVEAYYHQMLAESKALQRLVADLLDLSKLQNADFKIEKRNIYLCDVLDDVMRSAKGLANEKKVIFEIEKNTGNCSMMGDYDRIRQMFLIVIDNAVKFSEPGGLVKIQLKVTEKNLQVTIRDFGRGIPQEELPGIFERFYKLDDAKNKNGSGLGLAIAKQIAVRHGIEIEVNTSENEGSEFVFTILNAGSINESV